ncbi:hypothetical protein [Streptomyces sp. NPDC059063]|uniref:hypothetical protein n=1 Tax=unclassified Streptomyces TaxID=2593676 RepID=UPI0036BD1D42
MTGQRTDTTQEALAYVRRMLGPADPVRDDAYNGAARAPEGRAALERILAEPPEPHRRARGSRRRWLVVSTAMVVLVGVSAMADATGVLPSGVVKGLTRGDDDELGKVDLDKARMLVEGRAPDGRSLEVWQAPNSSGGVCMFTRVMAEDGTEVEEGGGGTSCSNGRYTERKRLPLWSGGGSVDMDGYYTTYGYAAKPAVSVRITWPDGMKETARLNADGYFMTFSRRFPWDTPDGKTQYRTLDALDRNGKVVASDPYA